MTSSTKGLKTKGKALTPTDFVLNAKREDYLKGINFSFESKDGLNSEMMCNDRTYNMHLQHIVAK